ncbi:MAG: Hemin transport system permease HmuU [Hyphomonadaceae bacterium]|nr:MAG: Hemin transport system permease HmuU [Hyphomonadaceae bacterium]
MRQNNPQNWTIVSFLLLAILAIISLLIGRANFAFSEFLPSSPKYEAALLVLLEVRLPRTLFAILCGAALAVSGAALQGHLRNPLADAGVLGISSFASLGAIIAIYFGLSSLAFWVLPAMAIVFAWLSMALLLLIVGRDVTAIYFILAGVLLSTISGALMTLALNFAPNPYAIAEIINWQIGSFSEVSMREVALTAPFIVIGLLILAQNAKSLDALSLGEETAQSFGLNLQKSRRNLILGVGLLVGAVTSISGVIGFVGLIVPHIVRPWVGSVPSRILLPSALLGACLTLAADILVRLVWFGNELKIGVIMAIIGAPFFLHLLVQMRKTGGK